MKKIFLLILISCTFSFSQISTIIGVNITVAGTATLKTLTGFNGNNYLQLAAGSGNSLKNNLILILDSVS